MKNKRTKIEDKQTSIVFYWKKRLGIKSAYFRPKEFLLVSLLDKTSLFYDQLY